jgi:hypothetical protein
LVDSYYDTFYYQYGKLLKMIPEEPYAQRKDNGVFNPIRLALNKQQTIPSTKKVIPFQDYETGVLQYGNANPASKDFDSLTDISMSKDKKVIEGRIAWQLLNVKDPSLKEVMGDIWKQGLSSSVETSGIRAAVVTTEKGSVQQTIPKTVKGQLKQEGSLFYNWKTWDHPEFYERLKRSYEIMQKTFQTK